jgi:uncharacterized protein (TIGR02996 family)
VTDRDALYAAILAAPDDDTPRLVYADYLDDTGVRADAIRARFIRNQVALARADEWSDEFDRLLRATAPVEFHYHKEWAAGLDGIALPQGNVFARGFLEQVTCYSKKFVTDGGRLFERHPVRAVKFAVMKSARGAAPAEELAACPHVARLHTVTLAGPLVDDKFVATVSGSRYAAGIRCVTLSDCAEPFNTVARLGGPWFPGLRELELWSIVFGTDGANTVARSGHLRHLTSLRVCHGADAPDVPIRGPGAVKLAESPHLRGLTELELRNQELRKKGAEAFATAYAWPGLKRLGLRGNGITGSAIPAFAANPHLRSLALIDFRGNDVKAGDLAPLAKAFPHVRPLTDDREHPVRLVRQPEDEP